MSCQLINTDCLKTLGDFPENTVDSIVTDPPYELGFMNKIWDNTGIAYNTELWQQCLRVLKPGGHLLAFSGARTYHRMAVAIEDAGFEIRDQIMWIYGSGFPKNHDVSKAIDKKLQAEREIVGVNTNGVGNSDHNVIDFNGSRKVGGGKVFNITAPGSAEAKQWDGWGTALKPAHEPIVMARKPLGEKTIADNVLRCGTGAVNIDNCRIGTREGCPQVQGGYTGKSDVNIVPSRTGGRVYTKGRWPANVILDEEAGKLLDRQSGHSKSRKGKVSNKGSIWGSSDETVTVRGHDDSGGASRFFYCPKASKKERGESNIHPTLKPIKLISYLVRLVTPPGGICLDPFMGSGTTGLACKKQGFGFIGIELDENYFKIARNRIQENAA